MYNYSNNQIFEYCKNYNIQIYSLSKISIFVFEYPVFGRKYWNIQIYSNICHTLVCLGLTLLLHGDQNTQQKITIIYYDITRRSSRVFKWFFSFHLLWRSIWQLAAGWTGNDLATGRLEDALATSWIRSPSHLLIKLNYILLIFLN